MERKAPLSARVGRRQAARPAAGGRRRVDSAARRRPARAHEEAELREFTLAQVAVQQGAQYLRVSHGRVLRESERGEWVRFSAVEG